MAFKPMNDNDADDMPGKVKTAQKVANGFKPTKNLAKPAAKKVVMPTTKATPASANPARVPFQGFKN